MGRIYDATWGRGFAALYDFCFKSAEEGGLRDMRRELLAEANGRTIDIGSGTGANLDLYPAAGNRAGHGRARPAHGQAGYGTSCAESGSQSRVGRGREPKSLPFEDASFDTAVFTLVLCTVPDPRASAGRGCADPETRRP